MYALGDRKSRGNRRSAAFFPERWVPGARLAIARRVPTGPPAGRYTLSKTVATPWPNPMHIVAIPVEAFFAFMR